MAYGAIILAGGRSSRMGTDKATLAWRGMTMIEHVVAQLLRGGFAELVVVAGRGRAHAIPGLAGAPARVVWDEGEFEGPLKALRLGLSQVGAQVAFACGCDLPFVNARLATVLCDGAATRDADIPLVDGRLQVLHAAYNQSCIAALDAMIGWGARKLQDLVPLLDARIMEEHELRGHDPRLLSFLNVNSPEDYARALRLAQASNQ